MTATRVEDGVMFCATCHHEAEWRDIAFTLTHNDRKFLAAIKILAEPPLAR